MLDTVTAAIGDPIIQRDVGVVAYFARNVELDSPRLRFVPRLPMSMVARPYYTDRDAEVSFQTHEVELRFRCGTFKVWEWWGPTTPEEAFGDSDMFTLAKPEGDLARAIRVCLADRYLKSLFEPFVEGHIRGYLAYLESKERMTCR